VLFEAKARGLPIISTAVGAIPENLGSHPGALLVPPHDPRALARAIQQLRARHEEAQPLLRARPAGFLWAGGS
jgi:glycosyltransferase involved in cell wall biosynthesis